MNETPPPPDPPPAPPRRFAYGVITGRVLTVLVVSLTLSIVALALIYGHFVDW
ncbi:MAG: hypothetical protein JNK67_15615 [Alphaproteobacteria bacterium]|nr:hypothetical protein [Alphaproteobacteria bacterium]